ncbi:hypothetical protein NDA02_05505 [Leptolyngbya sp. ST-U4]
MLNIAEYWIVYSMQAVVTVCKLVEGLYDADEFRADSLVDSLVFSELEVTAKQVLSGGQAG